MTQSLVDTPRCLTVQTAYVGSPRAVPAYASEPAAWTKAMAWGGTTGHRKQAVKVCLDTVAVLRSYREPAENETWLIPAASERRLLAQVNAIIALGPDALAQVAELALDPDVPDPGRVFAALFVIGCVEGHEWLQHTRETFVSALERNSAEAAAAIEALSLSPNREVVPFLTPLLADERPRLRAAALRILGFRGALPEDEWVRALGDRDATIVAAALPASLRNYDTAVCEQALQPIFASLESESLARLALRAGVSLHLAPAHACALQIARSDPSWADAAFCVAMFGYLHDARHIRDMFEGAGMQHGVRAAAALGSIELVPDLLELLHREDLPPETGTLAKEALTGISGLPFADTADGAQALALWSEHAANFDRGTRYRNGHPLTPESLLHALRTGPGLRSIRQNLYLELLAATDSHLPHFSAYDFVRPQVDSLQRIEQWLAASEVRR